MRVSSASMRFDGMALNRFVEGQLKGLQERWKLTPATMAFKLNPNWISSPHLLYVSARIARAIAKGNGRIIVSMPPRHGKSELITKYTTIWCLEHFPMWNTILATYGAELSTDFGREVRDIIQANEHRLRVRIRADAQKVGNWKTNEGGGMAAVGVGGSITGRGANVLLIDDYIKEIKEALSPTTREYIWKWFVTTAYTRIEPGGTCIIIATRWHDDDLIGRILKSDIADEWEYIRIPALADLVDMDGNPLADPLGREMNQALFPERYDQKVLLNIKRQMGSFFFNAMYQQRPESETGKLTDMGWLRIIKTVPNLAGLKRVRVWDMAATQGGGDYTVGLEMVYDPATERAYILNVIRERLSSNQVETKVRNTAIADGTRCDILLEQEPGASGVQLVQYFTDTVLPEFVVKSVKASDGKLARAQPFLAAAEAGRVYLLEASWNEAFIKEFGTFPSDNRGEHDDQIDCAAAGYTYLSGKKFTRATWGVPRSQLKDGEDPNSKAPRIAEFRRGDEVVRETAGIVFGRRNRKLSGTRIRRM